MNRVLPLIRPYGLPVAGGLTCLVLVTALQLVIPRFLGTTIDTIILTRDLAALNTAAGVILLILAVRSVLLYGQIFFGFYVGHRVIADLRQRIFEQIQRWSLARLGRWASGDVLARSLQDTQVIYTTLLVGLLDMAGAALMLAGILTMLFVLQWRLAAFTLVAIPILLGSARLLGQEIQGTSQRAQAGVATLAVLLRQAFAGARIIRAFAQEDRETQGFRRQSDHTLRQQIRTSQLIATLVPVVSFLTALGLVAVLWFGGRLVTADVMSVGSLVAFLTYAGLAVEPAVSLSRHYGTFRQGLGALDRVNELFTPEEDITEAPGAVALPRILGHVSLRNVGFSYDGTQWALREVTLDVQPGERIAVVGPSGAGKTTLINLLPRFHDPTEGSIAIDGHDLRRVLVHPLRRQIGLVPQETILFAGAVRDNIAYARPGASDADVAEAARLANAHEFISGLPDGYATLLGEEGVQLSGGQRQRIAIARAVLVDPRIIILDEATSALDAESERLIQEALDRLMEGRTTFVIAHRLSTVRKAHRIIVFERGRIVEEGSHDALMARGGTYARLVGLQLMDSAASG